ncbi:DinB family protein [Aquimarina brevivitae]|uniref:Putative damage-inducible protein DinB n=1 Tax=Aquimarina brevivitae TaxID=323412 RepID=A0A4Q7PGW2_9FLAO|nr:DinB family protein [Aquimarina brevivitae]RZS99158.1 putative damage-inducible protein DinB [Aquimarina brevivitae]
MSSNWYSFFQKLQVDFKGEFTLGAKISTSNIKPGSFASIWIRVENKAGKVVLFKNPKEKGVVSNTWKYIELEGIVNDPSDIIYIGGFCQGYGVFRFTDFNVSIKNYNLSNSSFEIGSIQSKKIVGWQEGTKENRSDEFFESYSFGVEEFNNRMCLQIIGKNSNNLENYTPFVRNLIESFERSDQQLYSAIKNLEVSDLDFIDENIKNNISSLLIHIAAVEAYYLNYTFGQNSFKLFNENTFKKAFYLDEKSYQFFKGNNLNYYLKIHKQVRKRTLLLFKSISDKWLLTKSLDSNTNLHHWMHVLEHQSYHLGQIVLIKKKLDYTKS